MHILNILLISNEVKIGIKNLGVISLLILFFNYNAFAETQSCERIRIDSSGFVSQKAAESWYPKNLNISTNYDRNIANFYGRSAKLIIRDDKKRMDTSFNMQSSSKAKTKLKFAFLPNGELHVDVKFPGGFKSNGGSVYKCSNWYKNKIINTSGINTNSNNYNSINKSSIYNSQKTSIRLTDSAICNLATEGNYGNKTWRTYYHAKEYVEEARRRGLSCNVKTYEAKFNSINDNIICNRVNEGKSDYLIEAKRRGLACAVEYEKQAANIQNNTSFSNTQNTYIRLTDSAICNLATDGNYGNKTWRTYNHSKEYVAEAKARGLNCGVKIDQAKKNNLVNLTSAQLCKNATYDGSWELASGYLHYVQEAKRRGLTCGVKAEEYKNQRIAEKKARQERIKAEQDRIKKKEEARKKKIAKEKARKKAEEEALQRKLAEEKRIKKLIIDKKIEKYTKEAEYFYQDITDFVKGGGEIDLVKLTDLFSKKPAIDKKWKQSDIKNYENLKSYLSANQTFVDFEQSKKQSRIAKANKDKNNTINGLNDNLKKLKTLLRENFGNDKIIKIIQSNIKKTNSALNENFNQGKASKVLNDVNAYLSNYFDNKNKLKELSNYINNKQKALKDILKNNFGTEKALTASNLISDIEKAKTLESKTILKNKIDIFIDNPTKEIAMINKETNLQLKFSNLLDNQICNRAVQNNVWISSEKDLIAEAKRRGLDCGINVKTESQILLEKSKKRIIEKSKKVVKKALGPCDNVSGGWGKAKCLTVLEMLPINLVCTGLQWFKKYDRYDGIAEIKMKSYDNIEYDIFNGVYVGKVKRQENNLLTDGSITFSYYKDTKNNETLKVKIDVGLLTSTVPFEQAINGKYLHSGYCQKRL